MKTQKLKKIISFGICLLLFLIPFQTRYFFYTGTINGEFWEYGSYTLYASELLLIVLAALALVDALRNKGNIFLFLKKKKTLLEIAVVLFLLYLFASNIWSVNHTISFIYTIRFIELWCFVWLLRSANYDFRIAVGCFIGGMVIQGALGIAQFFIQSLSANKWLGIALQDPRASGVAVVQTSVSRFLRGYGGMPHPNILGGWLSVALFVIVIVYNNVVKGHVRLFLLVGYGVLCTALIVTFSRSALLGFILAWIVLLAGALKKSGVSFARVYNNQLFPFFTLTVFLFVIFGVLLKEPFMERGGIESAGKARFASVLEEKSLYDRRSGIQESWDSIIKKNPLWGSGIGTYAYLVYLKHPFLSPLELQPVHLTFLLAWAELGIIGFVLLITIALFWLAGSVKKRNIFGLAMAANVLPIFLFDHYLWTLYPGLMLIGVLAGINRLFTS